jgi:threonine/homoserine/homoserine lactone efflux protein
MRRSNLRRGVYVACGVLLCIAIVFGASAVFGYDGFCGGFFPGLSVRKSCSLWGYVSGDMLVIALILTITFWPLVLALLVLPPMVGYWLDRRVARDGAAQAHTR